MGTRTIATRLQLRRDTDINFDKIKDTFVPLKGEVLLVDTTSDGLRSKIGDGIKTFAQLPFSDQVIRSLVSGIVVYGYYFNGNFYTTKQYKVLISAYSHKIYINLDDYSVYGYTDTDHKFHKLADIPTATLDTPGIMKLYNTTGNNIDGTMTQHSITTELNKKIEVSVGSDEDLIFTDFKNI